MAVAELQAHLSNLEIILHDCSLVRMYTDEDKQINIIGILQRLAFLMRSSTLHLKTIDWPPMIKLVNLVSEGLSNVSFTDKQIELILNVLRFLRNAVTSPINANYFLKNDVITKFAVRVLESFYMKKSESELLVLKICIQIFGNIAVSDKNSKPLVWKIFVHDNFFSLFLTHKNEGIQSCTLMVLYNCLTNSSFESLMQMKDYNVLIMIVNIVVKSTDTWGVLILDYLLQKSEFLPSCFEYFSFEVKIDILKIINEKCNILNKEENFILPSEYVMFIRDRFIKIFKNFLEPKRTFDNHLEGTMLLNILCSVSSSEKFMPLLQESEDLLKTCILVLHAIRSFEKDSSDIVLSPPDPQNNLVINKRSLIRLIGNLCYNCKHNQDLARDMEGIPLILDCTSLDENHPFITQWSIFAIRNLLDNNLENQAIVAVLAQKGDVLDSSYLTELGISIQREGDAIRIRGVQPPS